MTAFDSWLSRFEPPRPPNWRDPGAYAWIESHLSSGDKWKPEPVLAWELLRRNPDYRREWLKVMEWRWRGLQQLGEETLPRAPVVSNSAAEWRGHFYGASPVELGSGEIVDTADALLEIDPYGPLVKVWHPRVSWDWRIGEYCSPYVRAVDLKDFDELFPASGSVLAGGPVLEDGKVQEGWPIWHRGDVLFRVSISEPLAPQIAKVKAEVEALRETHKGTLGPVRKTARPPRKFSPIATLRLLDADLAESDRREIEMELFPLADDDDPDNPPDKAKALENALSKARALRRHDLLDGYLKLLAD